VSTSHDHHANQRPGCGLVDGLHHAAVGAFADLGEVPGGLIEGIGEGALILRGRQHERGCEQVCQRFERGVPVTEVEVIGKCDPGDYVANNPNRTWDVVMTNEEITSKLEEDPSYTAGSVTGFNVTERGVSGRIARITVVGTAGEYATTGWNLRSVLDLKDTRFWIGRNLNITGDIRALYDRLMCRPGLATSPERSITGGSRQAFSVGRIYVNAARGAVTWLHGPVNDKYEAMGAHRSFLGLPRALRTVDGGRGRLGRFNRGDIYWTKVTGAHEVHGLVLNKYLSLGGHHSRLGYPTTDVRRVDSARLRSHFRHGRITCNLQTSRCTVVG
jgi:hypothetical protein